MFGFLPCHISAVIDSVKNTILWGVFLGALGPVAVVWADEEPPEEELRVRTVEGRTGEVQRDDERRPSVMVSRVDVEGLMSRGQDLGDALGEVSGVYVQRSASFGQSA